MTRRPDTLETFRAGRFDSLSYVLHGAFAAQDYLGDTAGGTGVPMPDCSLNGSHYHMGSADDGNTEVTVHNVTQSTSAAFTLDAATEGTADFSLEFGAGDELAVEVTDTTTPGSDLSLLLEVEKDLLPADH